MDQHLRTFVEAHPEGWTHEEWLHLLSELQEQGVDTTDADAIGYKLENERLTWELQRRAVPGLGPRRIGAVVGRFGTLWNLRHADVEDVAEIKTIPGALAEKVVEAIRAA